MGPCVSSPPFVLHTECGKLTAISPYTSAFHYIDRRSGSTVNASAYQIILEVRLEEALLHSQHAIGSQYS